MKIATPVSSVQEVEMLLHYGADELYCGLNTRTWAASLGPRCWMNRRSPTAANLASEAELETVVGLAHAGGIPVHVTLNAPFYPGDSLDYIVDLARFLAFDVGVDGLIVSDLNLLLRLKSDALPLRLHLSSLGSCFNTHAVAFYRDLGVKRIILPRQLKLSEIRRIVTDAPDDMTFEVFALNDGCVYEEGFCQTSHTMGPFCMTDWTPVVFGSETEAAWAKRRSGRMADPLAEQIPERMAEFAKYRWYQNNCGSTYQADGLPNGPCSLCGFSHFRDWGVTAVKIVGREASFYRKMRSLQMVKAVMDEVERGAGPTEIQALARAMRATPEHCSQGYMCYFKDDTNLETT